MFIKRIESTARALSMLLCICMILGIGSTQLAFAISSNGTSLATVTFKIINGTWDGADTTDRTVTIQQTDGKGTLNVSDIPIGMEPINGFSSGAWDTPPNTREDAITGDVTYTYIFEAIPASEANVTFTVVNGTWDDGTTADRTVTVKLADGRGTLDALSVPTGMRPSANFCGGTWDVVPNTTMAAIIGDVTYTYFFELLPDSDAIITFRVINGTWDGMDDADRTVIVRLFDGKGTLFADDIPQGMEPTSGYEGGSWNVPPNIAKDAITENIVYIYGFTKASIGGGDDNPKPVTQYTLSFVSNGGSKVSTEKHEEDTIVQLTQVATWEGHKFLGWYSDLYLVNKVSSVKMTGNKTVYAKWNPAYASIPDALNGDDHYAYMLGYDDGLFHPMSNITRAEVAVIFYRLLKDNVRQDNWTSDNRFIDVNPSDWFNTAVSTMRRIGVVKGRGEEVFDPEANITRAEFAAIAARFDCTPYTGADKFSDIANSWAREEINRVAERGWVQGDGTGSFRPTDYITRAEVVTLINRMLNRDSLTSYAMLPGMKIWADNMDSTVWYYLPIQEATNSYSFDRRADGNEK